MVVCRFYQQGRCTKGETCHFEHPQSLTSTAPWRNTTAVTPSKAPGLPSQSASEPTVCAFFRRGTCKFGDRCKHSHDLSGETNSQRSAETDTRSNVVCAFYLRGACTKGENCPFRHDVETVQTQQLLHHGFGLQSLQSALPKTSSNASNDLSQVVKVIAGASVTFEDGAAIAKIALPADYSTIAVTQIPTLATPEALIGVLETCAKRENIAVVSWKTDAETFLHSAEVKMADGGRFSRANTLTRPVLSLLGSDLHVQFIHLGTTEAGTNRLQLSTVSCTWHNPTRTANLKYMDARDAERTISAFRNTEVELRGRIPTFSARGSEYRVLVENLCGATSEDDLRQYLNRYAPERIEMHPRSHEVSADELESAVKRKLESCGNLVEWTVSTQSSRAKVKALARFAHPNEASQAAKELEGWHIYSQSNDVLHVQHVVSVKLPVSQRVLAAIRPQLAALGHDQPSTNFVQVKGYDNPSKAYTQIRVSGTEKTSVARVKLAVEKLLAGNVVKDGDRPLTHPFLFQASETPFLNGLMRTHKVVIVCDRRNNLLRIYGEAPGIESAQDALRVKVEQLRSQERVVILDSYTFAAVVMGGFQAMVAVLGKNKVKLDITSDLKRVLVNGSDEDVETVHRILRSHDSDSPEALTSLEASEAEEEMLCAVCWTAAEDPVTTNCGHRYCSDCIESQALSTTAFPLRCLGSSGKCDKPLALSELRHILTAETYDNLLDSSLTQHVRSHPKDYSYCSTPDCDRIYRIHLISSAEEAIVFNCEHCLNSICTACHSAAHEGETCKEAKAGRDGTDEFAEWKKNNDVRDCPSCATPIQKSEGCNHMECKSCHAHICWHCMRLFDKSGDVYGHMTKDHAGDWGLEWRPQDFL